MEDFVIYQENEKQFIERIVFPRFRAEITFNSPISDIENIVFFDKCENVSIIARIMREAGEFIFNFNKPAK